MAILTNGNRAHFNNDAELKAIKAEVLVLKVGEYIDFGKRYIYAVREFASRHRHHNPEKKFSVYKQGMSDARIARIK
jgi:hypothetical protein